MQQPMLCSRQALSKRGFLLGLFLCIIAAIGNAQPTLFQHSKFVALNETDRRIDGRYIVVLDQDRLQSEDLNSFIATLLSSVSDKIRSQRIFQNALFAVAIDLEDDPALASNNEQEPLLSSERGRRFSMLSPLLDSDFVSFIEEEQVITSYNDQNFPPSWGLDRIDQDTPSIDQNYHYDQTGKGVIAYIVDTGIRSTHNDFNGRVTCGYNAFADSESCEDGNGHGTHVGGTVGGASFGVAKEVDLVTVKVLNNAGEGTTASILEGVDYVAGQGRTVGGPMVANLSLGGFRSRAINLAVGRGNFGDVFFAVAAGNEDRSACLSSPASSTLVTTVAATDRDDSRADFSNFGSCVDIFAPGVDILSAWHTGDSDYNTISGTSMASPHVAGVAALYLELEPNLTTTPLILRQRIIDDALQGKVTDVVGSPNMLLNTEQLFKTTASPPPPGTANPNPLDFSKITSGGISIPVWFALLPTVFSVFCSFDIFIGV